MTLYSLDVQANTLIFFHDAIQIMHRPENDIARSVPPIMDRVFYSIIIHNDIYFIYSLVESWEHTKLSIT